MGKRIRAFAPVSAGNFIVGFDILGLAVQPLDRSLWGDIVSVEENLKAKEKVTLRVEGEFQHVLPKNPKSNLVFAVAQQFLKQLDKRGRKTKPISLLLEKNLPVCSGLGSSGSSSVASAYALNVFFGNPFSKEEVLDLAGYGEEVATGVRPLDNIAPALYGGLCLTRQQAIQGVVQLPWPKDLLLVFITPEFEISTRKARAVLPKRVPLHQSIQYSKNLALFIAALYDNDQKLLAENFQDLLIEPARARLLPGFQKAKAAALKAGAIACSFSGSGPTNVAVVESLRTAERVQEKCVAVYREFGLRTQVKIARADTKGARVLE